MKYTPWYSWNTAKVGIKHQSINQSKMNCSFRFNFWDCLFNFNPLVNPCNFFTYLLQVAVTVQDWNDTPPKFSRNLYTESVSEGIPTGTKVAIVTVTDEDSTGQLNLIIKAGSDGIFTINSLGKITVKYFVYNFN